MPQAKFLTGSIMRHIWVMTSTATVGISALFLVDLLDIFYLSLLGEQELAAAVGYAGTITFMTTSIGIGLAIAMGAVVSKAIGAKEKERAKRLLLNSTVVTLITGIIVAIIVFTLIPTLLSLIGATGRTAELAQSYLYILVPSMPLICLAMAFGAALRAVGDAKLSMMSTLAGGGVNAVLDPILIFSLSMGIEGAAVASVLARVAVVFIAARGVFKKHQLGTQFNYQHLKTDLKPIFAIAGPAMLTNVATPAGNAVMTRAIAEFGDSFVAGWAVLGRIVPVAFAIIFALSGAIGPIVGQNFGAKKYDRVKQALTNALQFTLAYVIGMSLLIILLQDYIISVFDLTGDGAKLVVFYCKYIAVFFVFGGALFVANACFNNLGKAKYSSFFNIGKATLGTIPFVYFGALWGGVYGVLIGQVIGSVIFGVLGVMVAYRLIDNVHQREMENKKDQEEDDFESLTPPASSPLSSSCSQMASLNKDTSSE
ncbi:MATE family efflux transporter [Parashewanella spongiae]|uniref:MATE family efflux transporter n=1 Tax=Parashewanella spongiae TaxID=342950 RepID=A0A3A6UM63_9GAMM|nr:MATE family efflux transporter [Parashewanella spongiae]MCL1078273.1 MATE family efflux transporter [Parashewanella spongiae]RJY18781.1 MATE family efflux transporter [Parashewanella spongiae]